jgi:ATP-dependent DNA helicase RecQ
MSFPEEKCQELLTKHWGHSEFYPFQKKNIASILAGRDSLTVVPTGGGKSLCYQLPAMLQPGTALVISPLISLMQDQVESLAQKGIQASCLNSSLSRARKQTVMDDLQDGALDLLYIAPERFEMERMRRRLSSIDVSYAVVDEAHCISHWGHDFRDSYRNLNLIKTELDDVSVHAFTATATPQVQEDIVQQLDMSDPRMFVGNVDRANITYRVRRRHSMKRQVRDVIDSHEGEAGIVYCLRRDDVDRLTRQLQDHGIDALPYHAGMSDARREQNQEQFMTEQTRIIVATIAFGMGIDRPDIRFIVHAAMPKTLEHYHQETGRAGRDGLPAYCYLFFSGGDYGTWKSILSDSRNKDVMMDKLNDIYQYCTQPRCRHQVLVEYFGQTYEDQDCEACDYCLDELDDVEEPLIVAQKILSCVVRVDQQFGAKHVTDVLKGTRTDKVEKWNHDQTSTFGIMSDRTRSFIRHMIDQLQGQNYLHRETQYRTLSVTDPGRRVLSGDEPPTLIQPMTKKKKESVDQQRKSRKQDEWGDTDDTLFERLREKRLSMARDQDVPAYVIFPDRSLKEMASRKPTTEDEFQRVHGVGDVKLEKYGDPFIDVIREYVSS